MQSTTSTPYFTSKLVVDGMEQWTEERKSIYALRYLTNIFHVYTLCGRSGIQLLLLSLHISCVHIVCKK